MSGIVGFEGNLNNKKVFKQMETILPRTQKAIMESWFALGRDLKNEANREMLRSPKSGRTYIIRTKSGRARRHVASAPGETHANLSGKLRRSVSWKVHGHTRMDFGYGFSTTSGNRAPIYDAVIEDGYDFGDGRKIEPRPSIENAVKKAQRNTNDHFRREMLKQFVRVT